MKWRVLIYSRNCLSGRRWEGRLVIDVMPSSRAKFRFQRIHNNLQVEQSFRSDKNCGNCDSKVYQRAKQRHSNTLRVFQSATSKRTLSGFSAWNLSRPPVRLGCVRCPLMNQAAALSKQTHYGTSLHWMPLASILCGRPVVRNHSILSISPLDYLYSYHLLTRIDD
jgi:hypothetical protein